MYIIGIWIYLSLWVSENFMQNGDKRKLTTSRWIRPKLDLHYACMCEGCTLHAEWVAEVQVN